MISPAEQAMESASMDLALAKAHLIRTELCHTPHMVAEMKKQAIEAIVTARAQLNRAEYELEQELYTPLHIPPPNE